MLNIGKVRQKVPVYWRSKICNKVLIMIAKKATVKRLLKDILLMRGIPVDHF